ncbi:MAG TPA: hypothetical protein VEL76_25125 [Gemmataceae bacterium]|nr:hypothetical protein [Gemmataceae bacterium]
MRALPQFAFAVVALSVWASPGQTGDKNRSLKDDLKTLQGSWQTGEKAKIRVLVKVKGTDLSIEAYWLGETHIHNQMGFELKEVGEKRVIELEKLSVETSKLPRQMVYRVDKDELTLTVGDSWLKGEHRLTRKKK